MPFITFAGPIVNGFTITFVEKIEDTLVFEATATTGGTYGLCFRTAAQGAPASQLDAETTNLGHIGPVTLASGVPTVIEIPDPSATAQLYAYTYAV
jgi:hypothetical protein